MYRSKNSSFLTGFIDASKATGSLALDQVNHRKPFGESNPREFLGTSGGFSLTGSGVRQADDDDSRVTVKTKH